MNHLRRILLVSACLWAVSPTSLVFAETQPSRVATRVVGIDPASDLLPENLLRVHIRFTVPMREGLFSEHIEVIDAESGKPVPWVFFDSFYELWNHDRTRRTLLVDPGRVKTGLTANNELGRAFVSGNKYSIKIKPGWASISGTAIAQEYVHSFTAVAQVRTRINPENWNIEASKNSVQVDFQRIIDIHSLNAHMALITKDDEPIPGEWISFNNGKTAYFRITGVNVPNRIVIRNRFEDVAGNTIAAAFDRAAGASTAKREKQTTTIYLDDFRVP